MVGPVAGTYIISLYTHESTGYPDSERSGLSRVLLPDAQIEEANESQIGDIWAVALVYTGTVYCA